MLKLAEWTDKVRRVYPSAHASFLDSTTVSKHPSKAKLGDVYYWDYRDPTSERLGHVAVDGGLVHGSKTNLQILMAYPNSKLSTPWGTAGKSQSWSAGVISFDRFEKLSGFTYLVFSKTNGKNRVLLQETKPASEKPKLLPAPGKPEPSPEPTQPPKLEPVVPTPEPTSMPVWIGYLLRLQH